MTSETTLLDSLSSLQIERDIADAIISQMDRQAVDDTQQIALLRAKLRARDKLITRLSERIRSLEDSLYEVDLSMPPAALAEAFANLSFDDLDEL